MDCTPAPSPRDSAPIPSSPQDSAQQAQPHRKEWTEWLTGRWWTGSRTEIPGQEVRASREPRPEGQVGTGWVAAPKAPGPWMVTVATQLPGLHGDSGLLHARPTLLTLW